MLLNKTYQNHDKYDTGRSGCGNEEDGQWGDGVGGTAVMGGSDSGAVGGCAEVAHVTQTQHCCWGIHDDCRMMMTSYNKCIILSCLTRLYYLICQSCPINTCANYIQQQQCNRVRHSLTNHNVSAFLCSAGSRSCLISRIDIKVKCLFFTVCQLNLDYKK